MPILKKNIPANLSAELERLISNTSPDKMDELVSKIKQLADDSMPVENVLPVDRLNLLVNKVNELPYAAVFPIFNFTDGRLSVSTRTNKIKIPLSFHWPDFMTSADLRAFNGKDAKITVALVMIKSDGVFEDDQEDKPN